MSAPERIDCHTHTALSGHGTGTVREVAAAAAAAGLTTVALTEHLALPKRLDSARKLSMDPASLDSYVASINMARECYPNLDIITGLEVDWIVPQTEYEKADLSQVTYLLGSVHMLDNWAFDDPNAIEQWGNHDVNDVWEQYFTVWCEAVRGPINFSTMAHPDLPKKFGYRPTFDVRELYEVAAQTAAERGVAIEVNTAGLRKPVGELYPASELLATFCRAGVEATVGSDAHGPKEVAYGIDAAYVALRVAGYDHLVCPTQTPHEWRRIAL